jgi:hypothetical protein
MHSPLSTSDEEDFILNGTRADQDFPVIFTGRHGKGGWQDNRARAA